MVDTKKKVYAITMKDYLTLLRIAEVESKEAKRELILTFEYNASKKLFVAGTVIDKSARKPKFTFLTESDSKSGDLYKDAINAIYPSNSMAN